MISSPSNHHLDDSFWGRLFSKVPDPDPPLPEITHQHPARVTFFADGRLLDGQALGRDAKHSIRRQTGQFPPP